MKTYLYRGLIGWTVSLAYRDGRVEHYFGFSSWESARASLPMSWRMP